MKFLFQIFKFRLFCKEKQYYYSPIRLKTRYSTDLHVYQDTHTKQNKNRKLGSLYRLIDHWILW